MSQAAGAGHNGVSSAPMDPTFYRSAAEAIAVLRPRSLRTSWRSTWQESAPTP